MQFVTGATGLLGSHIVEQLVEHGERVRALVRPTSDTRFLKTLGVETVRGDLADPKSLERGMAGAEVVYHAAAKVGEWGEPIEFRRDGIQGTKHVLDACATVGVRRLIYVSSTSAYGHPEPRATPITEADPLGSKFWRWDYYTRSKVAAEHLVWEAVGRGLPVTVIRPSWLYGPRDRTSIHRLAESLRRGWVHIIGEGTNRINSVYVGNVAEACLLGADYPAAAGQAYNVTNDGFITQRDYLNLFADALGLPRPWRQLPYRRAWLLSTLLEGAFRLLRLRQPPLITRYAAWLVGRDTWYSTAKAEHELGWRPRVGYDEGIPRTAAWYRSTINGRM